MLMEVKTLLVLIRSSSDARPSDDRVAQHIKSVSCKLCTSTCGQCITKTSDEAQKMISQCAGAH